MLLEDAPLTGKKLSLEEMLKGKNAVVLGIEKDVSAHTIQIAVKEKTGLTGVATHVIDQGSLIKPFYFSKYLEIPSPSYLVLTRDGGQFTFFISLTHSGLSVVFQGNAKGLSVHVEGSASRQLPVALIVRGEDLYQTIALGMAQALQLTGGGGHLIQDKIPAPKWFEMLGWKSGSSLGLAVSHDEILRAVSNLHKDDIRIGFVLIEEGWQQCRQNVLVGFQADPLRFPEGLQGLVRDLHKLGVKHIGVWHGLMGGPEGVGAALAQKYHLDENSKGHFFPGSDLGHTFQFFHDYYDYLREQGITFTEVGSQSHIAAYVSSPFEATSLIKNAQAAIQAASSVQFDSFPFNADCLGNGNIFYWANSRVASAADRLDEQNPLGVMRSIRNNLSNSLWLQHLMQPDFDAWITDTPHKEMLAVFHALSGTLNCIADFQQHDKHLLKKMLLPSGKLILADRILTLTPESVFYNPLEAKKIYKAFTCKREWGIVAAFNLCAGRRTLHGEVAALDIHGIEEDFFAVYSYRRGFLGTAAREETIALTLKAGECDVFTFSPVKFGVAVFGCQDFFLLPGALLDVDIEEDSVHIISQVVAPLLLYSEKQVLEVRCNGHTVPWEFDGRRKTLSVNSRALIEEKHAAYNILFES